ncbi:hypothetical protein F385_2708 [Pantoea agglomerans 299R]|jgi:hypothetical protein|nr:hypothetical protein F385_2708 [Pantoea agglomerans 299R]
MSHKRHRQRVRSLFFASLMILSGNVLLAAAAVLAAGQSFVLPDAIFLIF